MKNPTYSLSQSLHCLNDYEQTQSIFNIEDLYFSYNENIKNEPILKAINFALFQGQTIGLYGDNGSGKTTFLRCITGLLKPQSGIIKLGSKIIKTEKDFYTLRQQVGYVLQNADDQLFFPSVIEDILFGPLNLGLSYEDALIRAREALETLNLKNFENRLNHELSGGEKKRTAIAAILAMHPKALLLDEPDSELDTTNKKQLIYILNKLDCAKIIISHDMNFIKSTCNEIISLKNGILLPFNNDVTDE